MKRRDIENEGDKTEAKTLEKVKYLLFLVAVLFFLNFSTSADF